MNRLRLFIALVFGRTTEKNKQNGFTLFFMQESTELHIGKIICEHLKKDGRSKRWLAEKVSCEYSSFCKILKKQFIDTELLLRISSVLQYDFFVYFSKYISKKQIIKMVNICHNNRE